MPTNLLIIYIITLAGLLLVALLVAAKNYKTKTNVNFILFDLFTFLYVLSSFISELVNLESALFWTRMALFTAGCIPLFFYGFATAFTNYKSKRLWIKKVIYFSPIIIEPLAFHPASISTVAREGFGTTIGKIGPLMWITLVYFILVFAYSFRILHNHKVVASTSVRKQIAAIIYGIGTTVVISLITQIILPAFGIISLGNLLGIPSTLLLVGTVGYAILWYQLFDIGLVILRSLGYMLTVGVVSVIYRALVLGTGNELFANIRLSSLQAIYLVIAALLLAVSFRPLLHIIEKTTDWLFYRDRYDSKHLLHSISKILSSEIELPKLCWQVVTVLRGVVRVNQVDIIVLENGKAFYEAAGIFRKILPKFVQEMELMGDKTIVTDDLAEEEHKAILRKYGISVYCVIKDRNEKIGYLLFSEKNSGALFNKADVQTIDTIADTLAVAIQNSRAFTQIQQFNSTLQAKIDKATAELHIANSKLKDADAIKDDFISMASHQLSTPLAVIDGYLSMANDGFYGQLNDKLAGPLKSALGRAQIMKGLVVDLLNISRMTAGKFFLEITPTNLNEMAPNEVEQLQNQAKEMSVKLTYHAPPNPVPIIDIDDQKISQAMMNLINNALHYAKNGNVDVYLDSNDSDITFKVIDDGMGVPENQKSSLFTKFFRADNARKESPNGTGIGLYLVKRVVEDHNGKVIFSSQVGKGSTFGFSLPIHPGKRAGQIASDKSSN